jgi:hypothetical protein
MMPIPVASESRPVMTLACLTGASMPPYTLESVVVRTTRSELDQS